MCFGDCFPKLPALIDFSEASPSADLSGLTLDLLSCAVHGTQSFRSCAASDDRGKGIVTQPLQLRAQVQRPVHFRNRYGLRGQEGNANDKSMPVTISTVHFAGALHSNQGNNQHKNRSEYEANADGKRNGKVCGTICCPYKVIVFEISEHPGAGCRLFSHADSIA